MAIDLMNLEPQKISKDLRGKFSMFYGPSGVGKTTLASKFEKALIAGFECGTNGLNNVYVQPVRTWQDWKSMVSQLTKKAELKDKFSVICIDTTDEAFKLCEKWLCAQHGVDTIKDVAAYGGGYKMLDDEFMSPFRELAYAGYGLIFISHAVEKTVEDERGEYTQIVPALPNRPFGLINKMVDVIGCIRTVPTEDGGEKRVMFFRSDTKYFTKSRFRFIKPYINLDYNEYVDAISEAVDKEVEYSGGQASNDANPYMQLSFEELMEEAKSLWIKFTQAEKSDLILKILEETFGKPTKFSDITENEVEKLSIALTTIKELD